MQKIKAIYVNNGDWFMVGVDNNGTNVTEIINLTQEYPDHTEYVYHIKSGEKTLAMIINCPVTVEYDVS